MFNIFKNLTDKTVKTASKNEKFKSYNVDSSLRDFEIENGGSTLLNKIQFKPIIVNGLAVRIFGTSTMSMDYQWLKNFNGNPLGMPEPTIPLYSVETLSGKVLANELTADGLQKFLKLLHQGKIKMDLDLVKSIPRRPRAVSL